MTKVTCYSVKMTNIEKKILIVEDETPMSNALQTKFESNGFVVDVAADGGVALDILANDTFQVILLDLVMPNADGFEFLESLQSKGNQAKVVVLSNLSQDEDKAKAKELGADKYFNKTDTSIADLIVEIEGILSS